jgi:RNA polymerase sigma-70 factor, ECF subfamily
MPATHLLPTAGTGFRFAARAPMRLTSYLDGWRSRDRDMSEVRPADLLAELLCATARGDQMAFAELYRLTSGKLYAIASRMLVNFDTAGEALQESYLRIWTQSAQYEAGKGQPIHWMSAIVRHVCIDLLRLGANRLSPNPYLEAIEEAVPPQDIITVDIERCMKRLDGIESKAILMAFHYGLSHAELAERFALPLGTMKSIIRRALGKLRECLESGDANA